MGICVLIKEDEKDLINYYKFPKRVFGRIEMDEFSSELTIGSTRREYYALINKKDLDVTYRLNDFIKALENTEYIHSHIYIDLFDERMGERDQRVLGKGKIHYPINDILSNNDNT